MAPTVVCSNQARTSPASGRAPRPSLLNCYREPRVGRRPAGVRREAVEDPRPPLALLVFVFFVAAFLVVVRALVEVLLLGDVFLVATFLVVVRGLVEVFFLGDAFLLAASDDFFFCLALVARFFFVKPEAAPPRAPSKAPATAPPRALPATPLASSAVSATLSFAVAMTPSLLSSIEKTSLLSPP
jgi:hypothetical protein